MVEIKPEADTRVLVQPIMIMMSFDMLSPWQLLASAKLYNTISHHDAVSAHSNCDTN
jgi:hypothetical protein